MPYTEAPSNPISPSVTFLSPISYLLTPKLFLFHSILSLHPIKPLLFFLQLGASNILSFWEYDIPTCPHSSSSFGNICKRPAFSKHTLSISWELFLQQCLCCPQNHPCLILLLAVLEPVSSSLWVEHQAALIWQDILPPLKLASGRSLLS